MILIPEIETVVILVPRTGTTALKNAVRAKYPDSVLLYRHMEADGVPHGYDRWRRVGVVRHPVARLWSLYKYLRDMVQEPNWSPGYADRMRATVAGKSFEDWLLTNETVFTEPYVRGGERLGYWPKYSILHSLPENRKSQFLYLRPDLGTQVWRFDELQGLAADPGVCLGQVNGTEASEAPPLTTTAVAHIRRCFEWDLAATAEIPALSAAAE